VTSRRGQASKNTWAKFHFRESINRISCCLLSSEESRAAALCPCESSQCGACPLSPRAAHRLRYAGRCWWWRSTRGQGCRARGAGPPAGRSCASPPYAAVSVPTLWPARRTARLQSQQGSVAPNLTRQRRPEAMMHTLQRHAFDYLVQPPK